MSQKPKVGSMVVLRLSSVSAIIEEHLPRPGMLALVSVCSPNEYREGIAKFGWIPGEEIISQAVGYELGSHVA